MHGIEESTGSQEPPQLLHQLFDHSFNKSLKLSSKTRKPIRVIRGYKLLGVYAPESRYRYDGLYIVVRAWMDRGNNPKGWKVCKFPFRRIPGQLPIARQGQAPKADVELKDADNEEDEGKDGKSEGEEESKPKRGSKVGPGSKGEKAKVGPKSKVKVEEEQQEEEGEGTEPERAKKGNNVGPKSKVKQGSEESEKPKRGRKVGPKSQVKDEEAEEEEDAEEEEQVQVSSQKGRKRARLHSVIYPGTRFRGD
ncbi:SAD/SRA domain protein [Rhizoctonia solani 123E]|uniref:SAD/SRA domain protein n=1 Tax=Rhizoctonia solani 123E TaxID=1423351 RepID=A0A074RXJ1_9AGAM|nr:SAD/SRA domain protein [Rhizoctonia solani 123E]